MRTIYKYPLSIIDEPQSIETYANSLILHCEAQDHVLCLWIEVNTEQKYQTRVFRVFGTGHVIPDGYNWAGTTQMPPFVWHVYERAK